MSGDRTAAIVSEEDERELTVQGTADADRFDDRRTDTAVDRSAASFVRLEEQLSSDEGDVDPEGRYASVVDADRVSRSVVPAEYPRRIESDTAVALTLAVPDGGRTTAYFAWPDHGDAPLARLLAALDIPLDSFADLNGRRLLVTVEDGYVIPVVPLERPRGSSAAVSGVAGCLAVTVLAIAGFALAPGLFATAWVLLAVLAATLFVLPVAIYRDAWWVRTHTDWRPGPAFWALCSLFVGLNVTVSAAYLYWRRRARPLEKD